MQKSYPPLSIWFYTFLTLFLLFSASLAIVTISENNLPKKLQEKSKAKDALKVVSIGSSLTGFAFYPDIQMNTFAKKEAFIALDFYRFAKGGRHLESFDSLFEALIMSKPDLVMIEEELLFYTSPRMNLINKSRTKIKNFIIALLIQHHWDPTFEKEVQYALRRAGMKRDIAELNTAIKQWRKRGFNPSLALDKFLTYAQEHNISVISYSLPFSSDVAKHYPKEYKNYEKKMRKQYTQKYAIKSIVYKKSLDKSYFVDLVHANTKGRKILSRWLIEQIKHYGVQK